MSDIFCPTIRAQNWQQAQAQINNRLQLMTRMLNSISTGAGIPTSRIADDAVTAEKMGSTTIKFSFAIPVDSPLTTGADKGIFPFAPYSRGRRVDEVYVMARVAPGTDKTLTIDVNKNGTTIFPNQDNRPSLSGTDTEVLSGAPKDVEFFKNDKFTVDVDVSTSGSAVEDVVVLIRGTQRPG